jgi:diguanylate cyclase (GGDEF)-like protein/PAS domain S-box-containing protein
MKTKAKLPRTADLLPFPPGQEFLRVVMENAPIGMTLVNPDGQTIYVNQAFADMFGRTRSEILSLTTHDLVAPEMADEAAAQVAAVLATRQDGYRAERLYVRADGTRFWGLISVSTVRVEDDASPAFFVAQITDIDRARRSEAAVAEAESRWNFALESAGQGVWDHDRRTGQSFYSRTWKTLRGFDPDAPFDSSQAAWLERVHPEDRENARDHERMLNSGAAHLHDLEYRERHAAGHYIWILSRGRGVEWFPDGSAARVIGTDTDITRIKDTERQLAVVLETMADGVVLFDENERIVYRNDQFPRLFPLTPHIRVPGARLADILTASVLSGEIAGYSADNLAEYIAQTRASLRRGGDWEFALSDGRWLYARARVVTEGHGFLSVISDITERKRAELEQVDLNRRLRELVHIDALTGLINRRAFDSLMAEEFSRSQRDGRSLALVLIDVDHFKAFNDTFGHPEGDECLRAAARTLEVALRRPGDHAARIGGEEFAVILSDTPMAGGFAVAEAIRERVHDIGTRHDGRRGMVTISAGVAVADASGPATVEDLIARADAALYAAKAAGRDRVACWEPDMKTAGGLPPAVDAAGTGGV